MYSAKGLQVSCNVSVCVLNACIHTQTISLKFKRYKVKAEFHYSLKKKRGVGGGGGGIC